MVGAQYSATRNELAYCRFCLHGFYGVANDEQSSLQDAQKRRDEHEKGCFVHGGQKTSFPDNPICTFGAVEKQVVAPFVVYADFESLLKPVNEPSGQHSVKYEEHVACSYAYLIVSSIPDLTFEPQLYIGPDAADHFLSSLQTDLNEQIMPLIERDVEMVWDEAAMAKFEEDVDCFICGKPLDRENELLARDHCHFTGRFRGAVHQECNFQYKIEKERYKLPILLHNLRGYDAHLIMQAVGKKHGRINVIPNNFERYQSFSIGRLKFLDSFQFLQSSLEGLAKQMNAGDFLQTARFFPNPAERALMLRKGYYLFYNFLRLFPKVL